MANATLTIDEVLTTIGRQYDQFEKIMGPEKGWSDAAFDVVFDSKMTYRQKLAALRVERKLCQMWSRYKAT